MRLQELEAGEIVTTHGVRGEVKVLPWADGPEFLLDYKRVIIGTTTYKVEQCRVQKSCNLVKLAGIDTMEQAQKLRGNIVKIYREDAPKDIVFAAELIDMEVYADNNLIGVISDVLDYPGNKVYVVKGEHEYMIPAVKQFVISTDIQQNRMQVQLIEGMRTDEN